MFYCWTCVGDGVSDSGKPSGVAVVRRESAVEPAALLEFPMHRGGWMPYLLRHAHAGDKRAWAGPDSARPLSSAGRREAHGLLTQLCDYPTRPTSCPGPGDCCGSSY